jgi:Uma2 family endonuclease
MKGCVTMPLPQKQSYTIEDIYALPDGTRAELIDGQLYMMAPPTTKHQLILMWLSRIIANYIDSKGGHCKVIPAPFAVFLSDTAKYVEPDISIICDTGKLDEKGCHGAPNWIIEIVSPSSKKMDYSTKLFKYRTAGVHEYWIVDADKNRIMAYHFAADDVQEYTFEDKIKVNIYDDLYIDFKGLNI